MNRQIVDCVVGRTTQAQRPGPRGRWIATVMRWPGSLQRMVEQSRYAERKRGRGLDLHRVGGVVG